jgi:hypothetical protein
MAPLHRLVEEQMNGTDWESFYDQDEERYRLEDMSSQQIRGLADGYDDTRIDAVINEYLRLRELTA